jgi:hypothetical protein
VHVTVTALGEGARADPLLVTTRVTDTVTPVAGRGGVKVTVAVVVPTVAFWQPGFILIGKLVADAGTADDTGAEAGSTRAVELEVRTGVTAKPGAVK